MIGTIITVCVTLLLVGILSWVFKYRVPEGDERCPGWAGYSCIGRKGHIGPHAAVLTYAWSDGEPQGQYIEAFPDECFVEEEKEEDLGLES